VKSKNTTTSESLRPKQSRTTSGFSTFSRSAAAENGARGHIPKLNWNGDAGEEESEVSEIPSSPHEETSLEGNAGPIASRPSVFHEGDHFEPEGTRNISKERWSGRNGHLLTYTGLFLFTFVLYFRPYELVPALGGLRSIAEVLAIITLTIYLPSQIAAEGSLTALTTEVKCILVLGLFALVSVAYATEPALAWKTFSETFVKVVLIFLVMINVLRTRARINGLIWLGAAAGVMLSYQALQLYRLGEFATEGYRVNLDMGGMFGNPNDMAIHLVIFAPLAFGLGLAATSKVTKWTAFAAAGLMVGGNMVTQSRGGFLGMGAAALVLVWKLSKNNRLKVIAISAAVGLLFIFLAPGNYGLRALSIFIPSLDPVGSSDQRWALLTQSILVTLRNPLGIGIGNFPVVGTRNLVTHNAYTQVSSELGLLAFAAYLVLLVNPVRKLAAVEKAAERSKQDQWTYYIAVALQSGIAAYMVASFFASVAYEWYVYYPIAFAVGVRRLFMWDRTEQRLKGEESVQDPGYELRKSAWEQV
jgi:O-antigen ligase